MGIEPKANFVQTIVESVLLAQIEHGFLVISSAFTHKKESNESQMTIIAVTNIIKSCFICIFPLISAFSPAAKKLLELRLI
jgi:hypothetical protein